MNRNSAVKTVGQHVYNMIWVWLLQVVVEGGFHLLIYSNMIIDKINNIFPTWFNIFFYVTWGYFDPGK